MHCLAVLTALVSVVSCSHTTKHKHSTKSATSSTTPTTTASLVPLPSPSNGEKFVLRTSLLSNQKTADRFNNLFVCQLVDLSPSWFKLYPSLPQTFTSRKSTTKAASPSVEYRNILYTVPPALQEGRHDYYWNNRAVLFDFAGWQFAGATQYNSPLPAGDALTNGTFYFDENTGLRWNNTINEGQDFKQRLACEWFYDTIQLFWVSGTEGAGAYNIPNFCAKVNLLSYAVPKQS